MYSFHGHVLLLMDYASGVATVLIHVATRWLSWGAGTTQSLLNRFVLNHCSSAFNIATRWVPTISHAVRSMVNAESSLYSVNLVVACRELLLALFCRRAHSLMLAMGDAQICRHQLSYVCRENFVELDSVPYVDSHYSALHCEMLGHQKGLALRH